MSNYDSNKSPRQMYAIGSLDGTECVPLQHPDSIQVEYATINDIILAARDIQSFAKPSGGDTVELTITKRETIVTFEDLLDANFTINTTAIAPIAGDRVYIFVQASDPATITFTGDLQSVSCGNQEDYEVAPSSLICLELVYSGVIFTGIDNC